MNESQLAVVSGHEIERMTGRHSAERIAEDKFWQTLSTGASVVGDLGGLVGGIGRNTLLTNVREDGLESDDLGVIFMIRSGYQPEEMTKVMEILKAATGPNRTPEFPGKHPDLENRIEKIKEFIEKYTSQL